jgi:acetyl-CoA carboxylase biotin carboxylase subunit
MRAALARTELAGVATNIALHTMILEDPRFVHGGVDTGFLAGVLEHAHTRPKVTHG